MKYKNIVKTFTHKQYTFVLCTDMCGREGKLGATWKRKAYNDNYSGNNDSLDN